MQAGELPILLSAPHGGTLEIPGVPPRAGEGLPRSGAGFSTSRDVGTEELARDVAEEIERRFGKKPYLVISRVRRRYLDPNRPPRIAYEDSRAKPVYDRYHDSLSSFCREALDRFGGGLLLDLHGQGVRPDAVLRGTKNGLTVKLLRQRYGEAAHTGPESLFGLLQARGWVVHPHPGDGKEQTGYDGGYIVQTYGSQTPFGIDAMQLEFGREYRQPKARRQTARVLVDALLQYADKYLKLKTAAAKSPSSPLKVAVYVGPGTGGSRQSLLKYHQGPLRAPADNPDIGDFESLATFLGDIAQNGAPGGVMPGTTAIAAGTHGRGRMICFSPHPEKTKGLEFLLERALDWLVPPSR